jgi:hypothetical protein
MRVLRLGIDHRTGELLYPAIDEEAFARNLRAGVEKNLARLVGETAAGGRATSFLGEVGQQPTVNLADPRAAGWSWLVAADDPRRGELTEILKPLAEHRGMENPAAPLALPANADWWEWQDQAYRGLDLEGRKVPHYVLLVGGPDRIPFGFQEALDLTAAVGRVEFDRLEDLQSYVDKLLRLERAPAPATSREVLFVATDGGRSDPTYYSRRWMVEPLADHVAQQLHVPVRRLLGEAATKNDVLAELKTRKPAVVYSATHGLGPPKGDPALQRRITGALCCQRVAAGPVESWTISADDVPAAEPFLEGGVLFQFACFGYGCPRASDYAHWLPESAGVPEQLADADFLAALPRKLLANPRGPIAYVGHLDTAWLHGFDDPEMPEALERWHVRIVPFKSAVEELLRVHPPGRAMAAMNERYSVANQRLSWLFDQLQAHRAEMDERMFARLSDAFIFRSDAQNYMVFGDPAARPRLPDA